MDAKTKLSRRFFEESQVAGPKRTVIESGKIERGPGFEDIMRALFFGPSFVSFQISSPARESQPLQVFIFGYEKFMDGWHISDEKWILKGYLGSPGFISKDKKRHKEIIEMIYDKDSRNGEFEFVIYSDD